jgi:hypothetical protein
VADFEVGANLPWIDYGQDFGASAWRPYGGVARPDRREVMRRELGRLAEGGAALVRWWLLGDGRAGLLERPGKLRVDERLLDDMAAAVAALREAGLRALFVLTDFLWFRPRRQDGAVALFGRAHLVRDPSRRLDLFEHVFGPIAERFGREDAVYGWDLMNEPEWSTLGVGTLDPLASIPRRDMRAYLGELAALFHARATQPVTVGLASVRWLPLLEAIDLDFHQVHWYESNDDVASLSRPVATRGLGGRPLLLGEFPTRGCSLPPSEILARAAAAGYSGALAWSLLATDHATDGAACSAALASWPGPRRVEARG